MYYFTVILCVHLDLIGSLWPYDCRDCHNHWLPISLNDCHQLLEKLPQFPNPVLTMVATMMMTMDVMG